MAEQTKGERRKHEVLCFERRKVEQNKKDCQFGALIVLPFCSSICWLLAAYHKSDESVINCDQFWVIHSQFPTKFLGIGFLSDTWVPENIRPRY